MSQRLRHIFMLAAMMAATLTAGAAATATSVLDAVARKINGAPSVTATYSIAASGGEKAVSGNIVISKQCYRLDNHAMTVWYDGVTQWTLDKTAHELSITEPTADEVMESNPFAIVNHYRNAYKARLLKSDKNTYAVELTPTNRHSNVRRAVLTVSRADMTPSRIAVTMTSGQTVTITVKSFVTGAAKPAKTFTTDASRMPKGTRINDLR